MPTRLPIPPTSAMLLAGGAVAGVLAGAAPRHPHPSHTPRTAAAALASLPLRFEENAGQTDSRVDFLSRGPGYTLFLTPTETVLTLAPPAREPRRQGESRTSASRTPASRAPSVLRMRLAEARPGHYRGLDELPGRSSYFLGSDPSAWRSNVPNYARVKREGVYPGVDLVYHGSGGKLEYDFIVRPGSAPAPIALEFTGADRLSLDPAGNLLLHTGSGVVRQHRPVSYQEVEGVRRPVESRFTLLASNRVGFEVGPYDTGRELVIDPVLDYSSYLGGSGNDEGNGIAVDNSGIYVTGLTTSTNFPTQAPLQGSLSNISSPQPSDVFVTKLSSTGSALVYSTYLGSPGPDEGRGIAVNSTGDAFVVGVASDRGFPVTAGAFRTEDRSGTGSDAFVTRLNHDGSALVYSTYLGGAANDAAEAIALDANGHAFVAGSTVTLDQTEPFPVTPGSPNSGQTGDGDAFVTKLNASGSALIYSARLGGDGGSFARDVAIDGQGNAYVVGETHATNFPTERPLFGDGGRGDAFALELNAAGTALVYSTYLSAEFDDAASGVAVDASGSAYVTGTTGGPDFPVTSGGFQRTFNGFNTDAFVTKIGPGGGALVYSTYLGGTADETATGIVLGAGGTAWIVGSTNSSNFPTEGAFDTPDNGNIDVFVTRLSADGSSLVLSSYLSGTGTDAAHAAAITLDGSLVFTGVTNSTDFNTVVPFQPALASSPGGAIFDAFVARICSIPPAPSGLTVTRASATELLLNWTDNSQEETVFEIERSTGGGQFQNIGTVAANVTTFPDTSAAAGVTYAYRVRATNACGSSAYSNVASESTSGVSGGEIDVATTVNFGRVRRRRSKNKTLVITNQSTAETLNVTVGAIAAASGLSEVETQAGALPFRIVSGGGSVSIPPAGTHSVVLRFKPRRTGTFTATLPITSSDADEGLVTVTLTGRGRR